MVIDADGRELELPSARLVRAILETLALRAGAVVQPWELVDSVWGEDPPATARKCLQTYIGGLRRSLGSSTIETVGGGYRLRIEADDVDLNRFERHIREAFDSLNQGDSSLAVESLSIALDLWRGEPLEELVDAPAGMAARARLSELHRVAEERLFEADSAWASMTFWWPTWRRRSASSRFGSAAGSSSCWPCTERAAKATPWMPSIGC